MKESFRLEKEESRRGEEEKKKRKRKEKNPGGLTCAIAANPKKTCSRTCVNGVFTNENSALDSGP